MNNLNLYLTHVEILDSMEIQCVNELKMYKMILLRMIMMMTVLPRCVELGWQGLMTKEVLLL